MKVDPIRRWDRECTLVGQIAACVSLLSFLVYLQRGDLLLYGDAVAHINIARRVFDSRTPGLLQLGTVWLPLPHLLMIPFLLSDSAWQTGIGGAIPSMVAYVLGTIGIFRLVRGVLSGPSGPDSSARIAGWVAVALYAANPNLMYMQTTAMTEPIYLAWFVWAVVHFSEFVQEAKAGDSAGTPLVKSAVCLAGACLTRYDGWFLSAALGLAAAVVVAQHGRRSPQIRRAFIKFVLIAAAAPALWLAYNEIVYRNPLEFANGAYSAKAIEERAPGSATYPGRNSPRIAFDCFFKAAEQTVAEGNWQKLWVMLMAAGTLVIVGLDRGRWPILLLLVPLLFYTLSLSYGSVPIYLPEWWPFSLYNVRFGLEMLPACVTLTAVVLYFALNAAGSGRAKTGVVVVLLALVAASYASVWRAQPVCFREAWVNSRTRVALETELAKTLRLLPPDATLLMYLGDHVGALQDAGIPLRRTINEGNHRPWKKPADPEGLWEGALAGPKRYADYVVTIGNDPVAVGVARQDLTAMVVIRTLGQPPATVYWTHRRAR